MLKYICSLQYNRLSHNANIVDELVKRLAIHIAQNDIDMIADILDSIIQKSEQISIDANWLKHITDEYREQTN